MRSIVIFRFFSHLSLLFVYQCITFLPLIFRFSFYTNTTNLIVLGISLDIIPNSFYHITAHNSVWFRNNEKNYLPISLAIHYNPVLQKYIISVISNIIF